VTALLQDLLGTPKSVTALVCAPLRNMLPNRQENRPDPRLIRPGVERC
jgi:hypothetical protein